MSFIETIKARARSDVKTIVLPESEDDRTILAAAKVLAEKNRRRGHGCGSKTWR